MAVNDESAPVPDQPTLTDGLVTLRPWRDGDIEDAVAGHDDLIARWFGWPASAVTPNQHREAIQAWRTAYADNRSTVAFVIEADAQVVGSCDVRRSAAGAAELSWTLYAGNRGRGFAARAVRVLADWAIAETSHGGLGVDRIEAKVEPGNQPSLRVATRAGLRREGVRRVVPGTGDRAETDEYVVLARLSSDPPLSDPQSFRALLNSFLPRKRAISQMLMRDPDGRVLLCQLTYKQDWDLPGGVVEVGESPPLAVSREVSEELGLTIEAGALMLTDWLPPWGGWDDAICLVFDGGTHASTLVDEIVKQEREIRTAAFCTIDEVRERAADFTARRVEAALANIGSGAPSYTESGR